MVPSSQFPGRGAAPTASALRMCLALLCAVLLSISGGSSAAASPSGAGGAILDTRHERHPQRRQLQTTQHQPHLARHLEELRHADGTCHASVLSSPLPSSSDQTLTMGIVFSATNNGAQSLDLSGLGVYLDPTASPQLQFDYDVYYMDGPYATALGGDLSGNGDWQPIASAADVTKNYFSKDDTDGTSFLSFGGNVVNVPSGQTRSIYMKFSENVVTVEDRSDPGATDAQAVAETGYVGMSTQIGRKDIISGTWVAEASTGSALDVFYPPARFVGKLWTGQGTCSPTAAPTTAEPSLSPTPKPTTPSPTAAPSTAPTPGPTKAPTPAPIQYVVTIFTSIKFTLFGSFSPSRRGLVGKLMSRSLQGDCGLTAEDLAFAEERLEAHALAVYEDLPPPASVSSVNIIITGYEDVSAAGDCSEIEFTYDQEISYQTDGSDEVTEHDLAKLPFEGDNAQVFADDLVAESPAGGKFTGATGASEATPPSGLQTRDPTSSPSVSVMPSYPPSVSPTWSPSDSPSTSSRPTMTAAPTSAPSVAPTTTAPPTLTMAPSPSPSMSPTMTAMPTGDPSAQPSMQPTVSSAPSGSPSVAPTDVPSFSPSVSPSSVPTTLINVLAQPYSFDVSYPPEEEENIETQIVQNVTRGVENVLDGTLFLLSESYGLQLAGQTPTIVKDENATAECAPNSPPENACSRFVCTMYFEHEREILPGIVTSWLLEVSDEIADEVTAVYAGQESVRTFQIMVFENVVEPPDSMDDVCPVVEELLESEPDLAEFNLLAVKCGDYTYEPPEDDDVFKLRGLRRRLAPGDLIVQFEVHAEYTPAKRDEAEGARDEEFAALVEDSINRDQGKELRNTLQEREIIAIADDGTVQTSEKLTDRPTRAPTNAAPLESPSDESSSNSTTIAIIVVCSLVAVSAAGFFLYKGIYANKKIDDVPDWLSEDYSSVVDYHKPKPAKTELLRDSDESVEVYQEEPMEAVVYADGERNIFGDAVGANGTSSAKKGGGQKEDWQDEKVDLRGSKGRHSDHSSSSQGRDQLDAFESRVRQKGDPGMAQSDSQAQLSAFDARLQRKLSGSRRQDSLNESMSTLDSFEERIMKKSGSGKSPIEHQSSNEFDERLQRKLERSRSGQRGRSPAQSAQEAFDERVRRKASSGTVGASASSFDDRLQKKLSRSRSRGSSVDSQGSGSSFEDRLKRKLSNSSTDRSKALASTQSSRRLDDLEARIRAKSRDGDKSRSRESSPGASFEDRLEEKLRRNNSRGALSSSTSSRDLDDFEARVAAKSKEGGSTRSSARSQGSAPSYEDRLKAKLNESAAKNKEGNRERSLANSMPGAHSSSSRNIDAFNARIAAKSKQGGESTRSLSTTSSTLDSFNARIEAKSKGAGPDSRDKQAARDRFKKAFKKAQAINTMKDLGQSEARSKERVEYNEKLSRQLQANRSESSSSLQEYEEKIRRKSSAEAGSRGPSPAPSSTYEDRLKQKLAQGSSESSRSRPTRALSATPSARSLNDFESRIAAKTKEGEGSRERARSSLTASTASSSSRVLDDLEARIAAKNREGGTPSRTSSSSGASRNRSSLSSSRSSQSKSSFEDKLAQKLASSGKSKKESTSASFEEKLAKKLADKKNKK